MNLKKQKSGFSDFIKTDRAILMICIGIALVFWMFTKMAHQYESTLNVNVNFTVPEGKILVSPPPEKIRARLTAGGWDLFFRHLRGLGNSVTIPLSANPTQVISTRLQEIYIEEALKERYSVENKSLENITLQIDDSASRKIPIELIRNIRLAPQYQLTDSVMVKPDSILMTGPLSLIKNFKTWYTQSLDLNEVDETINVEVPVQIHENSQIRFYPTEVTCNIGVEHFTEKTFEVPIKTIGTGGNQNIILFKRTVDVTCTIGLSKYEDIVAEQFEVVVDFSDIDLSTQTFAPAKIIKQPSEVRNARINPQEIEFYLKK